MFGVVATLVRFSDAYAHTSVRGGRGLGPNHARLTRRMGKIWADHPNRPALKRWLDAEWLQIHQAWDSDAGSSEDQFRQLKPWAVSALRLLAAADEACVGVGFGGKTAVSKVAQILSDTENNNATLGSQLDPTECSVQPKGRTPRVGCNLRSLSQHIALLPASSMVKALHYDPVLKKDHRDGLGVLLVPFPYVVAPREFVGRRVPGQHWGHLRLNCTWGRYPRPKAIARFVSDLMRLAERDGRTVDMVVLPELALSRKQLIAVWNAASRRGATILITGVHARAGGSGRNTVVAVIDPGGKQPALDWVQSKHHRWRVDESQITNYGLDHLQVDRPWWEDIVVSGRKVVTARFTQGASLACLVCEDLARVEPVQPVLREMGPSLLVALLMDGPQSTSRWAAKSATVFSEDPGSSVLTFTSLGLVRSRLQHDDRFTGFAWPAVALWHEPGRGPDEIRIAPDAHAVHFDLMSEQTVEVTLDGRDDGGSAEVIRLVRPEDDSPAFRSLVHPKPPSFAVPLYRTSS